MKEAGDEKGELPAHYPTIRGSLKLLGVHYLKSLDTTVRALGAVVICLLLFGVVWLGLFLIGAFVNMVALLFEPGLVGDSLAAFVAWGPVAVLVILAPPIIRTGVLGAGFEIPPLFPKGG